MTHADFVLKKRKGEKFFICRLDYKSHRVIHQISCRSFAETMVGRGVGEKRFSFMHPYSANKPVPQRARPHPDLP